MTLLDFLILSLFTWRLANFIYDDRQAGPYNLLHKIRYWIGIRYDERSRRAVVASPKWKSQLADMHNCIYCMSFWYGLGVAIAWLVIPDSWHSYTLAIMLPFALSAMVILMQGWSKKNG